MNFFGHAAVASWKRSTPAFVLGAMLPDFANMLGSRLVVTTDAELTNGVAFHHRTDHVFHEARAFRELSARARIALDGLGLRRGSARAVAHVGVEILLDGVLARDDAACAAYRDALELGARTDIGAAIRFKDDGLSARFSGLQRLLLERGVAARDVSPRRVGQRLEQALASHPRLALDPAGQRGVEAWARDSLPAVEAAAPGLLRELAQGLL